MSNLATMNGSSELQHQTLSGSLTIRTVDDLSRVANMMAASGFFSDCKQAAQAGVKMMAGLELGIPAFASISGVAIVQGKPVMGANLMAALVKRSGRYSYRITQHDDKICSIEFLEKLDKWGVIGTSEFSIKDAADAGLAGKDIWKKYPKNMLFARAISNGIRWHCPDLFLGAPVYTPEEMGVPVNADGDAIPVPVAAVPEPTVQGAEYITPAQGKRFWAIANQKNWSKDMISVFLGDLNCLDADGRPSSKCIQYTDYEAVCDKLADRAERDEYERIVAAANIADDVA